MNDYNQQIATRLVRLATADCTGALPISGYSSGAIYLLDGHVVGAESSRTPASAAPGGATLSQAATIAESIIDAALDLLSSRSTCSRFRPAKIAPEAGAVSVSVSGLLGEVTRRRRLLQQMAGVSADLALIRNSELPMSRVQLTAMEWALLIRVQPRSTPRDLAWALRRSVFGTTVDVHRLIVLGLLRTADRPPQLTRRAKQPPRSPSSAQALSFGQALEPDKPAVKGAAARKATAGE
ncbi:MAG TPA: hypothetical protein VFI65_15390 [Streptosporangiaceae bacterium]|nr:hypothetical protein [Streptosporangiaceae bacterium]